MPSEHNEGDTSSQEFSRLKNEIEAVPRLKYERDKPNYVHLDEFTAAHVPVLLRYYDASNNQCRMERFAYNPSTSSFLDFGTVEEVCPLWLTRNDPPSYLRTMSAMKAWLVAHPNDEFIVNGDRHNFNLVKTMEAFTLAWNGEGAMVGEVDECETHTCRQVIRPAIYRYGETDLTTVTWESEVHHDTLEFA